MQAYSALESRFSRVGHLEHIAAIATWDEAAMMPRGGGRARGEALATLAVVVHELVTAPDLPALLDAAASDSLDDWQRANLDQMARAVARARALPSHLVRNLSAASTACEQAWRESRAANDWAGVEPHLERVLALVRQKACYLAEDQGVAPYDALIDGFEPGLTAGSIAGWFDRLRAELPPLVESVLARQGTGVPVAGPFSEHDQYRLATRMMRTLGFDFDCGRLDPSHHPFCGGVPDDTRITTRYNEADFLECLMSVLHETGHALYQQGLPAAWRGQPVGDALGAAVHESQSLLMEMMACRSRAFFRFAAPIIREVLGQDGEGAWGADNLHRLATRVEPGFIRVDADEVTYPLHVILRFDLEQRLIGGDLEVADLPAAWNGMMLTTLGLDTEGDDARGVMQDVHWYAGLFGYFPTYTVGAMIAAQLFRSATVDIDDLPGALERGDFAPLLGWLRTRVHRRGRLMNAAALLQSATGRSLDPEPLLHHLRRRYLEGADGPG